jgi:hypothetical protein
MVIKWGKSERIIFDGPYRITTWNPPYKAAVYTIMIPDDEEGYFRLIYVGESSNLSERGFYKNHHAYNCWIKHAGNESNLFIGIHQMPQSTKEQRTKIEQQLISEYNPSCNS